MAGKIEMVEITTLEGFEKAEFCICPDCWGYKMVPYYTLPYVFLTEVYNAARNINGICFAIISDDFGKYVIGTPCNKGNNSSFQFYNAQTCNRFEASVRAVTFNKRCEIWTEKWLRCSPGSIWTAR